MLLKEGPNNTYMHLYCPGVANLCLICDESQESHSLISPTLLKQTMERIHSEYEGSERIEESDDAPHVSCSVCMMDYREDEIAKLDGKPHDICMECFSNFL